MTLDKIKVFCTDIDGVWTDGSMYYTENGDEIKRFHTYDSAGVLLLKHIGIPTVIITSENTKIVKKRSRKLNIKHVYQGIEEKLNVCEEICRDFNINLENIAYIGDDVNDISLLKKVGLSAAPLNAPDYVQNIVNWVIPIVGGSGVYRAFVEKFLKEIGQFNYCLKEQIK